MDTKKVYYYLFGFFFLALTLYAYAASFAFVPLIIALLLVVYWRQLDRKFFSLGALFLILIGLPIVLFYLKNQLGILNLDSFLFFSLPDLAVTRFSDVSIFAESSSSLWRAWNYLLNYILHLVLLTLVIDSVNNYFWHNLFFVWDVIFMLFGVFVCLKGWAKKHYRFLLLWLVVAPLTSSFVVNTLGYSSTRDIQSLPPLILLSAIGLMFLYKSFRSIQKVKKSKTNKLS